MATLIALGVLEEIVCLALLRLGDPAAGIVHFLGYVLAAGLFYLMAVALVMRRGGVGSGRGAVRIIVGAAIIFRITLLLLSPSLSTDLTRDRWEGKIQHAGFNPYEFAPSNPIFDPLRSPSDANMTEPRIASFYPPAAELLFRWDFGVSEWIHGDSLRGSGLRREKLLYVGFDLLTMGLLLRMLRRRGLPPERVLAYAWAPIVLIDVAGFGHVEAAALLFALLAVHWTDRHERLAGWTLGVAGMISPAAYLLIPSCMAGARRRGRFVVWLVFAAVLCMLPFAVIHKSLVFPMMAANLRVHLASSLHSNASLFALWWRFFHNVGAARLAALALVLLVIGYTLRRRYDPLRAAPVTFGTGLLTAPHVFPKNVLWLAPWLCFDAEACWLYFTVAVYWSYLGWARGMPAGVWQFDLRTALLEYLPVYALLAWALIQAQVRWRSPRA